jgi:hypothetical protein
MVLPPSPEAATTRRETMTKIRTLTGTALVVGLLLVALTGCEKGPAQKAGESVDDAVEKAGESFEKAGDSIRDAGRDARD